ncbi:MAG: C10 family peptidase [candidate division Zixibacteria bacterium]|nr:C10 family peptidase [candidate division Zixibacteria bacterium]
MSSKHGTASNEWFPGRNSRTGADCITTPGAAEFLLTAFFLILLLSPVVQAERATSSEMELVCRNWLTYMTNTRGIWGGSTAPAVVRVHEIIVNDTLLGRCFMIQPVGFVIVPVLKELPPVMYCSDENGIDLSEEKGLPALIKEVLQHRVRSFVTRYGSLDIAQPDTGEVMMAREQRGEWAFFNQNEETFRTSLTARKMIPMEDLGPLLTSTWHQGAPYNNFCPMGDGGRTVVGCVATAAAQIMAYYNWPPQGSGRRTNYWNGDYSCGGSSPPLNLRADFSDTYDWANIPDYCSMSSPAAVQKAVAELCYEVGVAYNMDYGRCGSGAYTGSGTGLFPYYFRYRNQIRELKRSSYTRYDWSALIRDEIAAGRPIAYGIYSHAIVADGWRRIEVTDQVHMNYGWGGSQNAWFSVDELYCPWSGCTPWVEDMLTNIEPDDDCYFSADTTGGQVPLPVSFTGINTVPADSWIWSFGDGDSAFVQSPTHVFQKSGQHDVTLKIISGTETHTYTVPKYINALGDTMTVYSALAKADSIVEVIIMGGNTVPLNHIVIPIGYGGPLDLSYDTFSTTGCRADLFPIKTRMSYDPTNKRMAFSFHNSVNDTLELTPGYGPILKLYFRAPHYFTDADTAVISLEGYDIYNALYSGSVLQYQPNIEDGAVYKYFICGDADGEGRANIMDVTYLIKYLYKDGPAPNPLRAADANHSGTVNIQDVTRLINFLYQAGPPPDCL